MVCYAASGVDEIACKSAKLSRSFFIDFETAVFIMATN